MYTIISRNEAKRQNLTKYFTGSPCVNGHISPRYTKNGICWECQKQRSKGLLKKQTVDPTGIISREDARQQGLTKYFTGIPCKNGHIGSRYVKTGQCCECRKQYNSSQDNGLKRRLLADYKKMLDNLTESEKSFIQAGMGLNRDMAANSGVTIYKEGEIWVKLHNLNNTL